MYRICVLFIALAFFIVSCGNRSSSYFTVEGTAHGTTYKVTYEYSPKQNFKPQIDSLLAAFDLSLSGYTPSSIVSKSNANEEVRLDTFYVACFEVSRLIWEKTQGAFDVTGAPFFDLWGFGYTDKTKVNSRQIDSIKQFVGMDKVAIQNHKLVKKDSRTILNFNAIAKGYSVDVLALWLEQRHHIKNYMVEIGGEIRCKGVNPQGKKWRIGIDKPTDGNDLPGQDLQTIIEMVDGGLATSGNYRRYYVENNQKISHTIDPRTGYPVRSNLLSATVLAPTTMEADAIATALMVMGLEESKIFAARHGYKIYLIYDESGEFNVYSNID